MIPKPNIDLTHEYIKYTFFPPKSQVFRAIDNLDYNNLKVVIIGQDPYHGKGQANGLAFSVNKGVPIPPSLMNIYREINAEFRYKYLPTHGDLTYWEQQGVLLLNSILTVREGEPASHKGIGWEEYTDNIIRDIEANDNNPVVYMLWGNYARSKKSLITNPNHAYLEAPHPSPLSVNRGFFGCGHFKGANKWLKEHGVTPIDWKIT